MIAQADAVRTPLPDKSVHCCVTSPPYWGLRKYAGEQGEEPLGLEPTPERHVERIVEICREVRRVLRDDGVFWLNYGDCYASGASSPHGGLSAAADIHQPRKNPRKPNRREDGQTEYGGAVKSGFAQGSLMMMPHRVALALQADGWIVRRDLIWWKRNPMPESINGTRWVKHRIKVNSRPEPTPGTYGAEFDHGLSRQAGYRDEGGLTAKYEDCPGCEMCIPNDGLILKRGSWRHTSAHEFIFMLTKKTGYWSNQEAVRETPSENTHDRGAPHELPKVGSRSDGVKANESWREYVWHNAPSRNPRSVLDVPTAPYKGAHYATFPPNLIAPLIRATCPRRCCPVCGQGWAAVIEKPEIPYADTRAHGKHQSNDETEKRKLWGGALQKWLDENPTQVHSYRPTCEHPHTQEEAVSGIVFDPFVGSGTTVKVAQDLLRKGIGIDISMEYLDLQAKVRIGQGSPSNVLDDLPLFQ